MDVKIPKKIHFIWFGDEMPWYTKYYISLVKEMYKGYKVKIWGEKDFDPMSVTYTRKAYEEGKWAFISDYLRAKILYEEGGIYLDTDMVPIKDVGIYLKHKVVMGFEYSKMVGTGFCAAEPKHPFFRKILKVYNDHDFVNDDDFKFIVNNELWTLEIVNTYGLVLNDKTQLLPGDIKVYPTSYFADMKINRNSVWLHDHKLTWTSPKKAKAMNFMLSNFARKKNFAFQSILSMQQKTYFRKNEKRLRKLDKAKEDSSNEQDKK